MDPSLIRVLVLIGGIFTIISFLVYINNRDRKRDAEKDV